MFTNGLIRFLIEDCFVLYTLQWSESLAAGIDGVDLPDCITTCSMIILAWRCYFALLWWIRFSSSSPVLRSSVDRSLRTRRPAAAIDLPPNVLLRRGTRQTHRSADLTFTRQIGSTPDCHQLCWTHRQRLRATKISPDVKPLDHNPRQGVCVFTCVFPFPFVC